MKEKELLMVVFDKNKIKKIIWYIMIIFIDFFIYIIFVYIWYDL